VIAYLLNHKLLDISKLSGMLKVRKKAGG
jgi:hypothetical protein